MKPYIHRNEQGGGGEAGGSPRCAGRDKTCYVLAYGLKPLQKRMFAPSIMSARPAFGAVGGVVQAGCAAAWALAGPGRAGIRAVNLSAYVHPSMWPAWSAAVVAVCSVLGAGPAVGSVPGVGRGAGAVAGPVAVLCRCCASVLVLVLPRVVDCGRLGLALIIALRGFNRWIQGGR